MKHCLIIELWGIGDGTLMTSALQGLLADDWKITILAKPQTCALLRSSYPTIHGIEFDAPWTVFYGKYKLWRWPWLRIFRVLKRLRAERFDAAISVRRDPRDHLLMWLGGVRRRIGFSATWSRWFLNEPIATRNPDAHRVEDWWVRQRCVSSSAQTCFPPRLIADPVLSKQFRTQFDADSRPIIILHCGARIAVRRWPEAYYRELMVRLRQEFDFQLVLIPDPDGYGKALRDLADHILLDLSLAELLAALSCATQIICNDSGPSHLADALGIPVIAFFGPQRPELFRPFHKDNLVIIRDICPYRPCSDYCRFPEAYCLTKLKPEMAWPEIRDYLRGKTSLPLKASLSQ
jgi:ADP-heptose:LPS heptosyltransferase